MSELPPRKINSTDGFYWYNICHRTFQWRIRMRYICQLVSRTLLFLAQVDGRFVSRNSTSERTFRHRVSMSSVQIVVLKSLSPPPCENHVVVLTFDPTFFRPGKPMEVYVCQNSKSLRTVAAAVTRSNILPPLPKCMCQGISRAH